MKPLPVEAGCTLRENEDGGVRFRLAPVGPVVRDPAVQRVLGKIGIPAPIISFDGNSNLCGCSPPDPNGAVGPNHVVTMSNLHFQIFNKTGNSLFGPAANNTLWSGFGGGCQTQNAGDPVVLYDQLADRWLLTQFTSAGPILLRVRCAFADKRSDWSLITVGPLLRRGNNFPDYPKAGMWPDAYYFSTREFAEWRNVCRVLALMRWIAPRLWPVIPIRQLSAFLAPPSPAYVVGDGLLPSDLDGTDTAAGRKSELFCRLGG